MHGEHHDAQRWKYHHDGPWLEEKVRNKPDILWDKEDQCPQAWFPVKKRREGKTDVAISSTLHIWHANPDNSTAGGQRTCQGLRLARGESLESLLRDLSVFGGTGGLALGRVKEAFDCCPGGMAGCFLGRVVAFCAGF